MFLSVGRYTIQTLQNTYRVAWQNADTSRRYFDVDLEEILRMHIEGHFNELKRVCYLMDRPNLEDFLNDAHAMRLLHAIPPEACIPGRKFREESEARHWRNHQMTIAYNEVHKTHIDYEADIRNTI